MIMILFLQIIKTKEELQVNNNKGITLVSLMGYVILTITILAVLTSLSIHFRRNLSDMDTKTIQDSKFDKINLQMLEETKTSGNSINIDETTTQKIVFTNGNTYTYDSSELAVYLNDNIEVIDNVTLFNATVEEKTTKQILKLKVSINGKERIMEYVVNTSE